MVQTTTATGASTSSTRLLIRARSGDTNVDTEPYWPTLWQYIDTHKAQSFRVERIASLSDWIETDARSWEAAGRPECGRWHEPSVLAAVREIRDAGEPVTDVVRSDLARVSIGTETGPRIGVQKGPLLSLSR